MEEGVCRFARRKPRLGLVACRRRGDFKGPHRSRRATSKGEPFSRKLMKASYSLGIPEIRRQVENMEVRALRRFSQKENKVQSKWT